jgi:hypothetical protein
MEVKLTVPSTLSDITLGQYQKFKKTADKFEGTNDFLLQKMIECFCNVELMHVLLIKRKSILEVTAGINQLFTGKYELQPTFKIQDIEFGFIPNLDAISQGEYIDLDTYITNWDDMHKAMAVMFRPIKDKKGDKYTIHDYQGTDEFAELMKYMPLDVALGAYVFFYHLGNELLNSTLQFLKEEALELITQCKDNSALSGAGITQSINLLTEKYGELMTSPENPFTSALHFSPIKSKKKESSKTS